MIQAKATYMFYTVPNMLYKGPNFYPPEGHDWVPTDPIRRAQQHNDALEHELYAHEVGDFRRQVFARLAGFGALDDGFGWAIFDEPPPPGDTVELGAREVLMLSSAVRNTINDEVVVPILRIITKEPVVHDDAYGLISEDVTIMPSGEARYFVDAVQSDLKHSAEFAMTIARSSSPVFVVHNGSIVMNTKANKRTQFRRLGSKKISEQEVRPFGNPKVMLDKQYALAKAKEIFTRTAGIVPLWQHDSNK